MIGLLVLRTDKCYEMLKLLNSFMLSFSVIVNVVIVD